MHPLFTQLSGLTHGVIGAFCPIEYQSRQSFRVPIWNEATEKREQTESLSPLPLFTPVQKYPQVISSMPKLILIGF
jgi:hypothetical protein